MQRHTLRAGIGIPRRVPGKKGKALGVFVAQPLGAGETVHHTFDDAFAAYWVRFIADRNTTATASLTYR